MNEYPEGVPGEFRGEPGSSGEFRIIFAIFRYAAPWKNVDWREFRSQPPQVFIILKGGPRVPQGSLEPTHGLLAWSSFLEIYHGPVSGNLLAPFLEIYWSKRTATHPIPPWEVRYVATNFLTG